MNHNTPNTGHRIFILTEDRTYLNPRVPCVVIILHVREHPYSQF
jgi:hypothetical protein